MIDTSVLISFLTASAVVILVPGSDVFLLLRLSLARGVAAGLGALSGVHLGNVIQASLMVSGVGLLVARIPFAIFVLKVLGAGYLIYLAIASLRSAYGTEARLRKSEDAAHVAGQPRRRNSSAFAQGLLTNLTNPKVLLFFVAFFPQFIADASNVPLQLLFLSSVFIGLAIIWEVVVVLGAAKVGTAIESVRFSRVMDTVCAVSFTVLAVLILVPSS